MSPEALIPREQISPAWPSIVLRPRLTGNCAGVDRSVEAYRKRAESLSDGEALYSVGEPAHNNRTNEEFRKMGIIFVDHISQVPKGQKAEVGPHGITDEDIQIARENEIELEETVCPLVKKPLREIRSFKERGVTTLYHGKYDENGELHPEARAAVAMGGNHLMMFTSREEALSLEFIERIPDPDNVAFVSQTTLNADKEAELAEELQIILPGLITPKVTDVCYATRNRQKGTEEIILMGAELIVVLASKHSSNGRNIEKVSKERGARVFFVDTASELDPSDFYGYGGPVGIVGAASTQMRDIHEAEGFFTSRGSFGPLIVDIYDQNGEVIAEDNITFAPPTIIQGTGYRI